MESNSHIQQGRLPGAMLFAANRHLLPAVIAVWIGLVGAGFIALLIYQHAPGQQLDNEPIWPESTHIPLDPTRCNLLVFLHPRCACSLSTLNELARIQSRCQDRLAIQIIVYQPSGAESDWLNSPNVRLAEQIPRARRFLDRDGLEATRFGAATSGQVILFSPTGDRVFTGGITPSRAHEGDSIGRQTIEGYVCRGEISVDHAKVFGCPLLDTESQPLTEPRSPNGFVK